MPTDPCGTNPHQIDKLVGTFDEIRNPLRLCMAALGVGLPVIVGLLIFLVTQSFSMSAKLDRLSDRIDATHADPPRASR